MVQQAVIDQPTHSSDRTGELVHQYIALVHSTARRLVRDPHLADDISQATFIVLMRKLNQLNPHQLPGWLVNTTRLTALAMLRDRRLQMEHEIRAGQLRARPPLDPSTDCDDARLLACLDEGLGQLNAADRTAVVIRFLQGKTFAEVGAATGSTEEAARKRVHRALVKLRAFFSSHRLPTTSASLSTLLAAQQPGPVSAQTMLAVRTALAGQSTAATAISAKVLTAMSISKSKAMFVTVLALLLLIGTVIVGLLWWPAPSNDSGKTAAGPAASASSVSANAPNVPAPTPTQEFDVTDLKYVDGPGFMVSALCVDRQNQLWVGTKTDGVRRYNPYADFGQRWANFDTVTGQAAVSSIAVDQRERVWVGLEHGGCWVYDGQSWQNYDKVGDGEKSASGPLGDHIFKIAVCPKDGAVWLATESGLTRYDDNTAHWSYFTRADGLPSDAASSIAFDLLGNAFVGTQCDGIAIATSADGYQRWTAVPVVAETDYSITDEGVCSPYINDMATSTSGVIYAGTNNGLVWTTDHGQTWKHMHGKTWANQLSDRPQGLPDKLDTEHCQMTGNLVNRLATDQDGHLYLAYAAGGLQRFTCQADGTPVIDPSVPFSRDQTIALSNDMKRFPVAGGMGQGTTSNGTAVVLDSAQPAAPRPGLPAPAPVPTDAELTALLPAAVPTEETPPILTLNDDWRTQGAWLGRYGRDWSLTLGVGDFYGYYWGPGLQATNDNHYTGPRTGQYKTDDGNQLSNDFPWYFIETNYDREDRYLEIPPVYFDSRLQRKSTTPDKNRIMAEMNDGDHMRTSSFWSPGLYYDITIPQGTFVASIYLCNNDGRHPGTAERDYILELRAGKGSHTAVVPGPPLAHARVCNFDNGVWKRFYVRGPIDLSIRFNKLTKPSIKWSAIMLDQIEPLPRAYFSWQSPKPPAPAADPAGALAVALQDGPAEHSSWWAGNQTRASVLLARWCAGHAENRQLNLISAAANYQARLFEPYEAAVQKLGYRTARDIEKSLKYDPKWPDNSGQETRDLAGYVQSNQQRSN